jgi:small-conductance mechanosensitive channel
MLRKETMIEQYFLTKNFYIFLAVFVTATLLYFLLKKLVPRQCIKAMEKFNIPKTLTDQLNSRLVSLLNIIYLVFVLYFLFSIPLIAKHAQVFLNFTILDSETLQFGFASLAKGVIVFYILLLITRILRKSIQIYLYHESKGEDVVSTVDILIYNSALIFIVLISFSIMGLSWKIILPVAGALGIGIGFGLQDIVNNFISGFVILMGKTIKRGDWITLGENSGKIMDIGLRTSTLRTLDNIDIIIPNSHLISQQLINWSYSDNTVRIHIPVGVSYSSDVNLVKETLLDVAKKTDFVLGSPPTEAQFLAFGNSSLDFVLLAWVNIKRVSLPLAKSTLNYMIWEAFKEKGIQIPFPQRDVWFRNEMKTEKESGDKKEKGH